MSVARALEQPLLRRFRPRSVRLCAAGGTYRVVCPRDARAAGPAVGGRPAYWASIWPASVALFRRLLRGPSLEGRRAADVGCGIGLAGLAAGLRGAAVTFCDAAEDALRFARFNAEQHRLAHFDCAPFDWERDPLPDGIDLLLLADVAYEYRQLRPLLRLCEAVLARPGGRVLLADPHRPTANDLVAVLRERGARVGEAAAEDPVGGGRVPVRIVELGGGDP